MASFVPSYKKESDFNNGKKVINHIDSPSATDFNNVIENILALNQSANFLHDDVAIRLQKAESDIRSFDGKLDEISETIEQDFSETKKKVENLYARTFPEIDVIDSSVAYQRIVPDGALPYAEVAKVGGMSHKSVNLIPFPYADGSKTIDGVTFTVNSNGSIYAKGTATKAVYFYLCRTVYFGSNDLTGAYGTHHFVNGYTFYDCHYSGRYDPLVYLWIEEGTSIDHTFYPMISKGSTALPYSPYFEGLRHAKVTEVKSIGANLFSFEKHRTNGYKSTFKVVAGATLYRNSQVGNQSDWTVYDTAGNAIGTFDSLGFSASSPLVLPSNAAYIGTIDTQTALLKLLYIGYNSDTTYRPYTETSLPVPEAVQALDGYGLGVDAEYNNHIDWVEKKYQNDVGQYVFDGTENWSLSGNQPIEGYSRFDVSISKTGIGAKAERCVCNKYDYNGSNKVGVWCHHDDRNVFKFRILTNEFSNSRELTTALAQWYAEGNPLIAIYPLAVPTETDISHLLPDDNFIRVEGGGAITAVNEYGLAAPITINYQVD